MGEPESFFFNSLLPRSTSEIYANATTGSYKLEKSIRSMHRNICGAIAIACTERLPLRCVADVNHITSHPTLRCCSLYAVGPEQAL